MHHTVVIDRLSITGGLKHGLSRMKGNFHVRFLGEGERVTLRPYPTVGAEDLEAVRETVDELVTLTPDSGEDMDDE